MNSRLLQNSHLKYFRPISSITNTIVDVDCTNHLQPTRNFPEPIHDKQQFQQTQILTPNHDYEGLQGTETTTSAFQQLLIMGHQAA